MIFIVIVIVIAMFMFILRVFDVNDEEGIVPSWRERLIRHVILHPVSSSL